MYKLIVKEVAYQMLAEAYQWYEAQSPGLGERLLGEVDDCFKKITDNPYYYSVDRENYRRILIRHFPYKIVYEISGKELIVYAVFHTRRNIEL